MGQAKRIQYELLDDNLKNLLSGITKPVPVQYSYIFEVGNPNNYSYVIIADDPNHKYEIYYWDNGVWNLVGANDAYIDWTDIKDVPTTFPPDVHNHDDLYYQKIDVDTALGNKSDTSHTHDDRYYTETEMDTKLVNKSDVGHNHDNVYYTETEVNTMMNGKSDITHTHATEFAEINDHETRIDNLESGYSNGHIHSNLSLLETLTQALVDAWNSAVTHISDAVKHITSDERTLWNTVSNKADTTHIHDDRYYTETEVDTKLGLKADTLTTDGLQTQINGKADSSTVTGHTGNSTIHVTQTDKDNWNGKADNSALTTHTGNSTIHITSADHTAWDAKQKAITISITAPTNPVVNDIWLDIS